VEELPTGADGHATLTAHALPVGAQARRAAAQSPHASQEMALATLRDEEADTARNMIRVGRLLGIAAALPMPFIGGSVGLRIAFVVAVAIAVGLGVALERRIARSREFGETTMVTLAFAASPAIFIAVLYFGALSAAQLFPTLALYFISRRESRRWSISFYLTNAITQVGFAVLIVTRAIDDPGLVDAALPPLVFALGHGLLQIGFFSAYLLGRGSHKAARDAIAKMQHAMMLAAQREALLHEARQDLDRALAIDAAGRLTDHTFGGYRLGNVIGRGGMGEVYEAFHTETGEPAAVKLLAQRELGDPHSVERFLREVRVIRGLRSPHVVRVLAASEERAEIPFLVMERLHGHDLAHHLRSGKMDPAALDAMLEQVGSAVEEAWQHGIVHRDLKPQNLFLADGMGWKVLDFGIAALEESSGTLTQGKIVGTPAYMAPEQARGSRVDHRADVYALAAIVYRWLTGRPAISGKDLHNALYQTVHVMPQPPSSLATLHVDVDAALAIGLCKRPEDRWASVAELRAAVSAAIAGELDAATRARAARILESHPWGAVRD
jgi:serine/threonine-protein kinase